MAYDSTTVKVEKSQSEIRKLLIDYGATRFVFGEEETTAGKWAGIEFVHEGNAVRMRVPLRPVDEKALRSKAQRAVSRTYDDLRNEAYEQEAKRVWRVLFWSLKARLVAVEEGLETFEQAFLAHLVDPASNMTVWQAIEPVVSIGSFKFGGLGLLALDAGPVRHDDDVVDADVVD